MITRLQICQLFDRYRREGGVSWSVYFRLNAFYLVLWLMILIVSALLYVSVPAQSPLIPAICGMLGLGVGAISRDTAWMRRTRRTWPVQSEFVDWAKVDAVLAEAPPKLLDEEND